MNNFKSVSCIKKERNEDNKIKKGTRTLRDDKMNCASAIIRFNIYGDLNINSYGCE